MTTDLRPTSVAEAVKELSRRLYNTEQQLSRPLAGSAVANSNNPSVDTITIGGIVVGAPASSATNLVLTTGAHMEDIWVDADWDAPADGTAAEYDVELARKVGVNYELVQNFNIGGGTSLRMSALEPQQTYGVRVTAINRIQARSTPLPSSGFQDITTGIDATVPTQVTGVVMTTGIKSVMITWDEVSDRDVARGTGQYEVHLSTNSDFTGASIEFTSATIIAFPDRVSNQLYHGRVRAIDNSGNAGAWSASVSGTTGQVQSVDLADTSVITSKLATGAVNTDKLADLAVEAAKLGNSSVTATKIANLAVGSAAIQALAVGTAHIADASILTAKIGDLAVTTAKIANLAVDNAKIADLAVDNAKIANLDAAKITAGTINADRIGANTIDVNKLTTSTLTSKTITIGAGGVLKVGNPPTTGLQINDQGLRLYSGGTVKVALDVAGTATFEGNISASTITSSTLTSATINSGTITGTTIRTAASGQRLAMEAGVLDALYLYTGNASESVPGWLSVAISGSTLIAQLTSPKTSSNDYAIMNVATVVGGNGSSCNWGLYNSAGTIRALLGLQADSNVAVPELRGSGLQRVLIAFSNGTTDAKLEGSGNNSFLALYGGGHESILNVNNGLGPGLHVMNETVATFRPIQASGFNVASSSRVNKHEFQDPGSMLTKLQQMKVIQFKRKLAKPGPRTVRKNQPPEPAHILASYDKPDVGFIAEELLEIIPDAVVMGLNGPTGYNISYIVSMLVKGLQELTQEIEELKAS